MMNIEESLRYKNSGKPLTIFLDFDGVINTAKNMLDGGIHFDINCIKNLQYFIKEYDAKICVISSWRKVYSTQELFLILMGAGLRVPEDNRLPKLFSTHLNDIRGPLIEAYCKDNDIKFDEILIIDDDSPHTLMDRWVKTNVYDGFTFSRALEAERILNGLPKTRDDLGRLLPENIKN